jgi:hypothetical protein
MRIIRTPAGSFPEIFFHRQDNQILYHPRASRPDRPQGKKCAIFLPPNLPPPRVLNQILLAGSCMPSPLANLSFYANRCRA